MQVKTSILKSGKKLESDIVIVGVGAKPNTDMFKGQIELLEDKPGGIKVRHRRQQPLKSLWSVIQVPRKANIHDECV